MAAVPPSPPQAVVVQPRSNARQQITSSAARSVLAAPTKTHRSPSRAVASRPVPRPRPKPKPLQTARQPSGPVNYDIGQPLARSQWQSAVPNPLPPLTRPGDDELVPASDEDVDVDFAPSISTARRNGRQEPGQQLSPQLSRIRKRKAVNRDDIEEQENYVSILMICITVVQ